MKSDVLGKMLVKEKLLACTYPEKDALNVNQGVLHVVVEDPDEFALLLDFWCIVLQLFGFIVNAQLPIKEWLTPIIPG